MHQQTQQLGHRLEEVRNIGDVDSDLHGGTAVALAGERGLLLTRKTSSTLPVVNESGAYRDRRNRDILVSHVQACLFLVGPMTLPVWAYPHSEALAVTA